MMFILDETCSANARASMVMLLRLDRPAGGHGRGRPSEVLGCQESHPADAAVPQQADP